VHDILVLVPNSVAARRTAEALAPGIGVATVDEAWGYEAEIVILSLSESRPRVDLRMLLTFVSRARTLAVLVGVSGLLVACSELPAGDRAALEGFLDRAEPVEP
jgi:hypothetical protein